jgi:hypothetical protein
MSTSYLGRAGGSALFIGALLSAPDCLLKPEVACTIEVYFNPLHPPSTLLTLTGAIVILMGFPANTPTRL